MSTVHLEVPDEDSLLKVKPVKAAQSISAALSRQTRKKAAAKDGQTFTAEEAADVLALNLRNACHTGTNTCQRLQLQSASQSSTCIGTDCTDCCSCLSSKEV